MIDAIRAERKSMTTRIMKPQPSQNVRWDSFGFSALTPIRHIEGRGYFPAEQLTADAVDGWRYGSKFFKCRYGQVGDILWVKEKWWHDDVNGYMYFADTKDARPYNASDEYCINEFGYDKSCYPKWKSPMFMKREAARLLLKTTNIKVERLNQISEQDAISEGVLSCKFPDGTIRYKDYMADASGYGHPEHDFPTVGTAIESFKTLFMKIHGKPKLVKTPSSNGELKHSYVVFCWDEQGAEKWLKSNLYRGKSLLVITNPWTMRISFKVSKSL